MRFPARRETGQVFIFLLTWTIVVLICFLHVSGTIDCSWIRFPQAKGNLVLYDTYRGFRLLGLRDQIFALPPGVPFVHAKRTELIKKNRILISRSIEEAKRMIDFDQKPFASKLNLLEKNVNGYDVYELNKKLVALSSIDPETGNPVKQRTPYHEIPIGNSLAKAREILLSPTNK